MKRLIYLILFILVITLVSGVGPKPTIFVKYSDPGEIFNCTSEVIANISAGNTLVAYYNSSNSSISNITRTSCINVTFGLNMSFITDNPLVSDSYIFSTVAKNNIGLWGDPNSMPFTVTPFNSPTLVEPVCSSGTPQDCFLGTDSFSNLILNTTPWDANCKYRNDEADPYVDFSETGTLYHNETGTFPIPSDPGYLKFFTNCTEEFFNTSVLKNFTFYNGLVITLEEPVCGNPSYCNQTSTSIDVKVKTSIPSNCKYNYTIGYVDEPDFADMKDLTTSDYVSHEINNIDVKDDNYTAFYVTCIETLQGTNASTQFNFHGKDIPPDPDESQTKCSAIIGYTGICGTGDQATQVDCWDSDATVSPPDDRSCCGDDGSECWLDDNNHGCCEIDVGGGKIAYVTDVDISLGLCYQLGEVDGIGSGSCSYHGDTYCWVGGHTPKEEENKNCCGDDTDETWSYTTNSDLDDILVTQTCYDEYWKLRDSVSLTYYYISVT